jgi:hypothetical protein
MLPRIPISARYVVALALLCAPLLGACRDTREEAREELRRLHREADRHALAFGHYPRSIDPARPAGADNLAFSPAHGVAVTFRQAGPEGFNAVARQGSWICVMLVQKDKPDQLECTPGNRPGAPPAPASNQGLPASVLARDSAAAAPAAR